MIDQSLGGDGQQSGVTREFGRSAASLEALSSIPLKVELSLRPFSQLPMPGLDIELFARRQLRRNSGRRGPWFGRNGVTDCPLGVLLEWRLALILAVARFADRDIVPIPLVPIWAVKCWGDLHAS